jgi:uncharacterized protein
MQKSREFQIFVKPVGPVCNLRCSYCYYLNKKSLFPGTNPILMQDSILEKYVIQHIEASTYDIINFSWHGGEPLLAGIDFFRKVVRLQNKYKPAGVKIINGIQTNGTLLNEEWCHFLAKEGFHVGLSIDGPDDLHNNNRHSPDGGNTFDQVINGYRLLQKNGIVPEILCVVNAGNVKFPLIVYRFFRQLGAGYITFLPLVEREPGTANGVSRNSVNAGDFGLFLSEIFDEWVENDIGSLKVQIFEEACRTAFNQDHTLCIFRENCGGVPVVEHTGDFYSCDHYVDSGYLLGNIRDYSLSHLLDSERQKAFGQVKSLSLPRYCVNCEARSMCNGECPKNRFIYTPDGEEGLNYLCTGYKYFFNHCRPFVEAITEAWNKQD